MVAVLLILQKYGLKLTLYLEITIRNILKCIGEKQVLQTIQMALTYLKAQMDSMVFGT